MKHYFKLNQIFLRKLIFLLIISMSLSTNAQCWKTVSSSGHYSIAIKSDGTLWGWGENSSGQLGDGTTTNRNTPVQIGTDTQWKSISTSVNCAFAIKNNGTLWAWGFNYHGRLGIGSTSAISYLSPVQVGTDTNWKLVSGNGGFCIHAIKSDGTLWSWGDNIYGLLGNGVASSTVYSPIQIGTDTNWKDVTHGLDYAMAIKSNGTLWAWGKNTYGSLGDGTTVAKNITTQIGTDTDWNSLSASANDWVSAALKNNGKLYTWGKNDTYFLGDGTNINRSIPTLISSSYNWNYVNIGYYGTCMAIKSDGTMWRWGSNSMGEYGNGTTTQFNIPTQIGTNTDWVGGYSGGSFSFLLNSSFSLSASGQNVFGELGNGTNTNSTVFVQPITTCSTIIANNDNGTAISGTSSTTVANVLANDIYNGSPATTSNVTLTFVNSNNSGITLNTTTGAVSVAATVQAGSYTLTYQICATAFPTNCATGTVTITVNLPVIDAVNDNFSSTPIDYVAGGTTASVTTNDTLNGIAVNNSNITITLVNNGGLTGATISNTGVITIPAATNAATYTLTYQICQNLNNANCDQATVIVVVNNPTTQTPNIVFGIRANNMVNLIDTQSTGKIIIGGSFTTYNNISAQKVARLNTDLTLDTSFLSTGSTPFNNNAYDLKIQSDDKIILVGAFTGFNNGTNGRGLIRLNSDGTVDTSFNNGGSGFGTNDIPRSCAIQADGKILIGGGFITSYNGVAARNMIRLNTDGTIDNTFNFAYTTSGGNNTYGPIFNIVVQPDGKILAAGNRSVIAGGQPDLFRLNSDGSIDTSFIQGDTGINVWGQTCRTCSANCVSCLNPVDKIVLQPDNKIIVVGTFETYNGGYFRNIVRLLPNGAIDTSFNGIGNSTDRAINDIAYDSTTNKMFIGGEFAIFDTTPVNRIIRLNSNGSLDTTFSSGTGTAHTNTGPTYNIVQALKKQGDGKVIVGGTFTSYNGISALNITRIQPSVAGGQARTGTEIYESEPEIDINAMVDNTISLYPNPSHDIFNIDLSEDTKNYTDIEVFNILGVMVYKEKLAPKSLNSINLSQVVNGYYIARIFNQNESKQFKLIKK